MEFSIKEEKPEEYFLILEESLTEVFTIKEEGEVDCQLFQLFCYKLLNFAFSYRRANY